MSLFVLCSPNCDCHSVCFTAPELSDGAKEVFPLLDAPVPWDWVLGAESRGSGENQKLLECPCPVPTASLTEESAGGGWQ